MNLLFEHITPTANISITLSIRQISSATLNQYEDTARFSKLCEIGCINYDKKWSCPPYSPGYSLYSGPYQYGILCLFYCDLSQFNYTKTEYMKIKASNSILKAQADKLSRFLETNLSGKALSTGSCRLCKPCSKKSSSKEGCRNPLKLRYSLEALGLNVVKLSDDLFRHKLLWYSNKTAPKYSSVICGVLTNSLTERTNLLELITNAVGPVK